MGISPSSTGNAIYSSCAAYELARRTLKAGEGGRSILVLGNGAVQTQASAAALKVLASRASSALRQESSASAACGVARGALQAGQGGW